MTGGLHSRPSPRQHRRAPLLWGALVLAVGALLLALVLVPIGRQPTVAEGRGAVGNTPPALDAVDLSGRRWTGDDLQGRVIWVNFWATWCPPCRIEMPMMQRLAERYGDRLLILGVDFGEERSAVADFVERYGITYPILLDPTLDNFYRWNAQFGLPRHFFIDADGIVVRQIAGELSHIEMARIVEELLGR